MESTLSLLEDDRGFLPKSHARAPEQDALRWKVCAEARLLFVFLSQ